MLTPGHRLGVLTAWVVLGAIPAAAQESGSAPPRKTDAAHRPRGSGASVSPVATESLYGVPVSVLVAPVQGSEALRVELGEQVVDAVRGALEGRGYRMAGSQELLGQAVVACQTPECVEQVLDAAGAAFGIVPAIWLQQSGGKELTLTLVQRSGRNLNASGTVGEDLGGAAGGLVDELLERRAGSPRKTDAAHRPRGSGASVSPVATESLYGAPAPVYPRAWKAGPIVLIVGGVGVFVGVGVAAGIKSDSQQLNTAAVAAWSAVGAAAIGGGIAWWVVGEKRRRRKAELTATLAPAIGFRPSGIDLRLRF